MNNSNFDEVQFLESNVLSPLIVDRESGILRNVKILGFTSRNGRRYLPEAMREGFKLYENKVVNKNHDRENGNDRDIDDRIGRIVNARFIEGEGIFGDVELLKSHPMYERLMESAEKMPNCMGFSHLADCARKRVGGVDEVIKIRKVYSVDLVANPATTTSLAESEEKKSVKSMCEKCCKMESIACDSTKKHKDRLKLIAEEYGMTDTDDSDSSSSDTGTKGSDGDGGSSIKSESMDPIPLQESAVMPDAVEQIETPAVVSADVQPIAEGVQVKPVGTPLNEVQELCAVAGIVMESTVLESLTRLSKAEVIPLIRRVALAESVSKPVTSIPSSASVASRIPEKNVSDWLKS
jgi:hypothetical protein